MDDKIKQIPKTNFRQLKWTKIEFINYFKGNNVRYNSLVSGQNKTYFEIWISDNDSALKLGVTTFHEVDRRTLKKTKSNVAII